MKIALSLAAFLLAVTVNSTCDWKAQKICSNKYASDMGLEMNLQQDAKQKNYTKFCGYGQLILNCAEDLVKDCNETITKLIENNIRRQFDSKPSFCQGLTFNPNSATGQQLMTFVGFFLTIATAFTLLV